MKKISRKRIIICFGLFIVIAGIMTACFCHHKYNSIFHTISRYPSGLNITLYENEYGRGFSWWTEVFENNETKLYISENVFEKEDFANAIFSSENLGEEHIEGVYLIEGETENIKDTTRWGRLFSVKYCNHTVNIKGLLENQQYYYAIGGNEQYYYGEFQTESDHNTVIVNFNDFQTSDGTQLFRGGQTLNAALKCIDQEVDFFAFGGDFTSIFSIGEQQYNHYLGWIKSRDSLSTYIKSTPMIMAPGNHDATKSLFESNNSVLYKGLSDNGGYHSFNYNNIHFITLNSNEFNEKQYKWLKKDLEEVNNKDNITWTIVMLHQGPYTTGDHGVTIENQYVEKIANLCSTYHVDLVLQAHDHVYCKTLPYLWDCSGVTTSETDKTIVNKSIISVFENGIEYDWNPNGTYYISCGASGHRVGENTEYALTYGEKSFRNREYKVIPSEIKVDSIYADVGDMASMDVGQSMFGILKVFEQSLVYEFYVVDNEGLPVLFDRLAILK